MGLGDTSPIPDFDTVVCGMSALYENHHVSPIQRGYACGTDTVLTLHADDDDLGVKRDEFAKLRICKRVILSLVDDMFVREGRENELPSWCVWCIGVRRIATVAYMDDPWRGFCRPGMFEDALDVLTDGLGRRDTFLLVKHVGLDVNKKEDAAGEARGVLGSHWECHGWGMVKELGIERAK